MAVIEDTLSLVDRFTSTFTKYLSFAERAAGSTTAAQTAAERMGRTDVSGLAGSMEKVSSAAHTSEAAVEGAADAAEKGAKGAAKATDRLRESQDRAAASADGLARSVRNLVGAYLSLQSIRSALNWVGENLQLSNIQRNAENQLRAVLSNMGAQEVTVPVTAEVGVDTSQVMSAFDAITAKASEIQGRGIYGDEAMIAGAAELGTYFKDANAIMSMMDTLADYTMGMTGGGAVDKTAMVQYATDIGKIMSGSYVAMTRKGFEFTEAQKAIIEGAATETQIVNTLGREYLDMSADMQAAAAIHSVIAESWGGLYETMSATPEGKIIQFQNRLGDLREVLGDRVYPAVIRVVDVFNNGFEKVERILTACSDACSGIIIVIGWIAQAALTAGDLIVEHGDLVISVLLAIAAAAAVTKAAMVGSALASAAAWAVVHWPLLLIIAVIVGVIQKTLQMGGTWADVCGFIGSVLYELYAFGYNLVADAWNLLASFGEFFANFLDNPVAAVAHLLADLADWALDILRSIASGIDAVFGSSLASAVNGWRSSLQGWVNSTFGENKVKIERMEKISYGDAWTQGNVLGRNFYNTLTGFEPLDMSGLTGASASASALGDISDQLGDIAGDTKAIKNSVSLSEEDIKSLVDLAERRYVNNINLTAQSPVINVQGQNTGNTAQDRKALADTIKEILIEQSAAGSIRATARV